MHVLISDANILIDMHEGGILNEMFQLQITFKIPDALYEEELSEYYPQLVSLGLITEELSGEGMLEVMGLNEKYRGPSFYDCLALALAKQENCPLLSGDGALRKAANREGVEVRGTIWIVEELVKSEIITTEQAQTSYESMREAGSRLPWDDAFQRLNQL